MIKALANSAARFDRADYLAAAERAAMFVLTEMRDDQGRLRRSYRGTVSPIKAYLDDYAYLVEGLIALHVATREPKWLNAASRLTDDQLKLFWDEAGGGFFFTATDHEELLARSKDRYDSVVPSGNSTSVRNLIRLASLTGKDAYRTKAEQTLKAFTPLMSESSHGFANMALGLFEFLDQPDAGTSRRVILREVDASLQRLGTDWIDVYYLHSPDYSTPLEEALRALDDCVRAGKVRYIACSNYYAWQVCEGLWRSDRRGWAAFACVQPLYNLLNRDAEVELFPFCQKHGLGVVPYSPLARGVLSGKYQPGAAPPEGSRAARGDRRLQQAEWREESLEVAQALRPLAEARGKSLTQWALAWVLANPIVTSAIIGPRTLEQLEDHLGALGWRLTPEEEKAVDRLVPPGEHTGKGYNDPAYPVRGRPAA